MVISVLLVDFCFEMCFISVCQKVVETRWKYVLNTALLRKSSFLPPILYALYRDPSDRVPVVAFERVITVFLNNYFFRIPIVEVDGKKDKKEDDDHDEKENENENEDEFGEERMETTEPSASKWFFFFYTLDDVFFSCFSFYFFK